MPRLDKLILQNPTAVQWVTITTTVKRGRGKRRGKKTGGKNIRREGVDLGLPST